MILRWAMWVQRRRKRKVLWDQAAPTRIEASNSQLWIIQLTRTTSLRARQRSKWVSSIFQLDQSPQRCNKTLLWRMQMLARILSVVTRWITLRRRQRGSLAYKVSIWTKAFTLQKARQTASQRMMSVRRLIRFHRRMRVVLPSLASRMRSKTCQTSLFVYMTLVSRYQHRVTLASSCLLKIRKNWQRHNQTNSTELQWKDLSVTRSSYHRPLSFSWEELWFST